MKKVQITNNGSFDTIPFTCSQTTYVFKISNRHASLFLNKAYLGKYMCKLNNKAIKQCPWAGIYPLRSTVRNILIFKTPE